MSVKLPFYQRVVFDRLASISQGGLTLIDGPQQFFFGDQTSELQAKVTIHTPMVYRRFLIDAEIGAGVSFAQGEWSSDDLTKVIQFFAKNLSLVDSNHNLIAKSAMWAYRLWHRFNDNTKNGSQKNIAEHYDLGNEMFKLWLDPAMQYSSAIFPDQQSSLADAQQHKLKVICDKLALKSEDHLLEVGTGWGGLACFAAQHYDCNVTTITISDQQYQYAKAAIEAQGLTHKVTVLKQDYRELQGKYDKLVSIEMIEAVGHKHLSHYFNQLSHCLKPTGKMLIQAITIADQRYDYYRNNVDFIQRFIFPGGSLPSLYEMLKHLRDQSDMTVHKIEDYSLHYAETLKLWFQRFSQASSQLKQGGYDDYFQRLWHYYLAYCEGGFREGRLNLIHFEASKVEAKRLLNPVPHT